jgi:UDP-galactopyranose mutase
MYDFVIVGSGFFGSICANELQKTGKKILVLEKRNHIGGNCYTDNRDGINLHMYGPHIFHTSNKSTWEWINNFVEFNNFIYSPVGFYKDQIYSLPFNMWTFSKIYGLSNPNDVESFLKKEFEKTKEPKNLEERAIQIVGERAYKILIEGYTKKQWKKEPKELPREIIDRLPVRLTYDANYFNDRYQGIPIGGYTQIFEKLLKNVEVRMEVDFFKDRDYWTSITDKIIYTGSIDKYYNYVHGSLEYKTTKFNHKFLEMENYQGVAVMNHTEFEIPYTRTIEHKHFEKIKSPNTWVSWEYPTDYVSEKNDPYYPVNDRINNEIYLKYKEMSLNESNVYFGGRLAEYKYYDMHQVIESALNFVNKIIKY